MFNLEQSLAEWRQQMLSAGIQSPVPLEELEIHLREEIERRMKSGLDEAQAFNAAVQNLGQCGALQNEFSKVKARYGILQTIGLIIGWLVAGCALIYATMGVEFHWNFFNFHEKWDMETMIAIAEILAVETGFWFLAKASHDRVSRVVSLLVCIFLAGFAICFFLPPEALTVMQPQIHPSDPGGAYASSASIVDFIVQVALSRHAPSPLWYRGSLTLLFFVPGIFHAWQERRTIQKSDSKQEQYV